MRQRRKSSWPTRPATPFLADMAGQHAPSSSSAKAMPLARSGRSTCLIVGHFVLLSAVGHMEASDAMSTPCLVCLGEPLIEFNRPREGDGELAARLRRRFAECRDRGGAPRCDDRRSHQSRPGLDRRRLPRAVAVRGVDASRAEPSSERADRVSFVTHSDAGQSSTTCARFRGVPDDADACQGLHRRRPVFHLSAIGQAISESARQTCDAALSAARAAA